MLRRFFPQRFSPAEELYVLIATFNHEKYIAQAIEGVLRQKVDLPLRIFIRDDASTDASPKIIAEYAARFPELIFPLLNQQNQYSLGRGWTPEMFAVVDSYIRVSKENVYVALCEGDDYWTHPRKLQRQVDVLRREPEVDLVHHAVDIIVEPGGDVAYKESLIEHLDSFRPPAKSPEVGYFRDRHNVMTCSAMARFESIDLQELESRPPGLLGDWILFAHLTQRSPPGFIKKVLATYRIHSDSTYSSLPAEVRAVRGQATHSYLHGIMNGRICKPD